MKQQQLTQEGATRQVKLTRKISLSQNALRQGKIGAQDKKCGLRQAQVRTVMNFLSCRAPMSEMNGARNTTSILVASADQP